MFQNRGPRDNPSMIAHQILKELEFERLEIKDIPCAPDFPPQQIHRQFAHRQTCRFRGSRRSPQKRLNPGKQFPERKRLCKIIISAAVEPADFAFNRIFCAEHEQRHFNARLTDSADHSETVKPGQHDIDDRQIERSAFRHFKSADAILRVSGLITGILKPLRDKFRSCLVIFDNQNFHSRFSSLM